MSKHSQRPGFFGQKPQANAPVEKPIVEPVAQVEPPVAPVAPVVEPVKQSEPSKDKKIVKIRTVYGDMVDPTNSLRYTTSVQEVIMTPWIQIQVDADKIIIEKE